MLKTFLIYASMCLIIISCDDRDSHEKHELYILEMEIKNIMPYIQEKWGDVSIDISDYRHVGLTIPNGINRHNDEMEISDLIQENTSRNIVIGVTR